MQELNKSKEKEYLTTDELFDQIISDKDWYKSFITSHNASMIKRRHKDGEYRSYEWLFKKFGYEISWRKINNE